MNAKVAIVGTGFIADLHMEGLNRTPDTNVVCCCDISAGRSASFARRWNIPAHYADLQEMLQKEQLDVAHVLVPPNLHFPISSALIEKGVHVFLEKPMGLTAEECKILAALARSKQISIGINHNFIFYPLFLRLKRDISNNVIGKPEFICAYYGGPLGQLDFNQFGNWMFRTPGNIILEQGPHPISQVRDILGDVQSMKATAISRRELSPNQYFYSRWQALAECERGHAFLHLSFGKNYSNQRNIHVFGRDGSIFVDFLNNLYLVQKKSVFPDYIDPMANGLRYMRPALASVKDFSRYAMSKLKLTDRSDSFFSTVKNSVSAFYQARAAGKPLPCDAQDGIAVIGACEKWIQSAGIQENPTPPVYQIGASPEDQILVTGATGFIGGCLVDQLVEKGHSVRILVRNTNGLPRTFLSDKVHVFKGDITDPASIRDAVKGVHFVYHLAHSLGKTWDEFEYFNINPARCLAEACLKENARFIFASTIAVFYYADIPGGIVRYDSPIDSKAERRNLYARSKIVEENLLTTMQKENGLRLVIARPGIVVGRNGILEHSGVGLWTRDNVCAFWGQGDTELPFVLVEDTASALAAMMREDGIEGNAFNLIGDVRLSAREYVESLRRFSQRNITAFPYPSRLMYLSDAFKILIKKIGRDKNTFLSYRDLANRSIPARFDTGYEKEALSWIPCSDREEFIEKAFRWAFEQA